MSFVFCSCLAARVCMYLCMFWSMRMLLCMCGCVIPHQSCPRIIAVRVEAKRPSIPSRACQGLSNSNAAIIRAPLRGLFSRITREIPRKHHSENCSRKDLSGRENVGKDGKKRREIQYIESWKKKKNLSSYIDTHVVSYLFSFFCGI